MYLLFGTQARNRSSVRGSLVGVSSLVDELELDDDDDDDELELLPLALLNLLNDPQLVSHLQ